MSSQEPELDALIDALRSDLPSEDERERLRARVLTAGVALSAAGALTSAASVAEASARSAGSAGALNASGSAAGIKLAGTSLAGKLGWSAVVIASASALSLAPRWYATGDAKPPASTAAVGEARVHRQQRVNTDVVAPAAAPQASAVPAPAVLGVGSAAQESARAPEQAVSVIAAETARLRRRPSAQPTRVAPSEAPNEAPTAVPAAVMAAPEASASEPVQPQAQLQLQLQSSTLRHESALIERALTALRTHHRASARRLLAVHAQRFPDGALRRERERLEMQLDGSAVENPEPDHSGEQP
ncbi:MAG TPA: hypothetical protein VK509_08185 [Polyangiales bacterium]|nr:hypothetical protein [Polyangiales bacterium]